MAKNKNPALDTNAPPEPLSDAFEVGSVKNPRYENAEHSSILCDVFFPNHPLGFPDHIPFHAHPGDSMDHGRDIYERCVAGEFGPVADYVPDLDRLAARARTDRDTLLARSDWSQFPDIKQAVQKLWQPYRQALRDVPNQKGFPLAIKWPEVPKSK